MATVASVMAELQSLGTVKTREIYARHGMAADKILGVSMADLKVIAKGIKGEQQLACDLYETGIVDAMYLAGMVADGRKLTRGQLEVWAAGAVGLPMIAEYTVPWMAVDNQLGREMAVQWIGGKAAPSGWCTYSGLIATQADEALDLAAIEKLLAQIVKKIGGAENRERHTMNGFVIAVGAYVAPLTARAVAVAREIGKVSVDMGDTACTVPDAVAAIQKIEAAGRLGKKRKTIRC